MAFCVDTQGDRERESGGGAAGAAGWLAVLDAEEHVSPTKISPREPLATANCGGGSGGGGSGGGGGVSMPAARLGGSDAEAASAAASNRIATTTATGGGSNCGDDAAAPTTSTTKAASGIAGFHAKLTMLSQHQDPSTPPGLLPGLLLLAA